jgi:hypothetical protein
VVPIKTTPSSPDRAAWQRELARERTNLVGADFPPRLAVLAVAVRRDRAANRQERSTVLFAVLDPKLLIGSCCRTSGVVKLLR